MRLLTLTCLLVTAFGAGRTAAAIPAPTAPDASVLPIAPALPELGTTSDLTAGQIVAAHAPERVLVPSLHGVIFVGDAAAAQAAVPAGFRGLDTSRVALFAVHPGVETNVNAFLNQPASLPSLGRLTSVVQLSFLARGERFVVAYVPPQDLTDGVVRVVVVRARLEGEVVVEGAHYFSPEHYRRALPLAPGSEIDAAALQSATDRLNRNPFRQVLATVEAGADSGTSRIALRALERRPWEVSASYSNAGTPTTGEDRVGVGLTWGNAFGRGEVLGYSFGSDAQAKHMISHSTNYTTTFASGHALTCHGSWSRLESAMPVPLTQQGHTWQTGASYALPLRARREGWTQSLSFSADFKYSDNTLEFAAIPITNNVTHVAQIGATYGVSFHALGGQNAVSVSGFASPGGLTRYNTSSAFVGSRPGAKADYVYGKLNASHRRALPRGFSWLSSAEAQVASGALLGSEQLNGGGMSAVRGYGESTAFGDGGVVMNHELHAPGFSLLAKNDRLDVFAFVDLASLNLNVDRESTDLRSAGVGLTYQWSRHLSVRASYGWQLHYLDRSTEKSRAHLSANLSF